MTPDHVAGLIEAERDRDAALDIIREAVTMCSRGRQRLNGLGSWFESLRGWEDRARTFLSRVDAANT